MARNTDIIRQPLSITLLLIILLLGVSGARYAAFPYPEESFPALNMPLGGIVAGLQNSYPLVCTIIALALLFVNSIMISRTVSRHMMYAVRTYLPSVFYIIVSAGIFFTCADLNVVIACFLLIRACELYISSFKRAHMFNSIFRASLLLGLTPLFYGPSVVFIFLLPLAIRIFRRSARESIVGIAALLLPSLLCAYVLWALGLGFSSLFTTFWEILSTNSPFMFTVNAISILMMTVAGLIILLIFLSLGTFLNMAGDMRTRALKIYISAFWVLVISLGGILLPCGSPAMLAMSAIPAGVLIPAFFARHTGWVPAALYVLLIVSVLALNLLPFAGI